MSPSRTAPPRARDAAAVCAGVRASDSPPVHGPVVAPIHQTTLFTFETVAEMAASLRGDAGSTPFYSRYGNPTVSETEELLAALEGAEAARAFGSGMAAISAAVLSAVAAGGEIVAEESVYWPTRKLLEEYLPRFGVTTRFVDARSEQAVADALSPRTQLLYLESPSTGVYRLQDIQRLADLAHGHDERIVVAVDNSWASPVFQQPLAMGADLVVHSMTKYLGGHSDVLAGVVAGDAERIAQIVGAEATLLGGVLAPFDAWLITRGLRTLPLRMDSIGAQALEVARFLEQHDAVSEVNHPGLESHPQHALAERQMSGYAGVFSFRLRSPDAEAATRLLDALDVFRIGISWGGFESLAFVPELAADGVLSAGSPIRLSVGLEPARTLIDDLAAALSEV